MNKYFIFISLLSLIVALDLESIRNAALAQHNKYRKAHGAPNLSLDASLNTMAQNHANKLSSLCRIEHSGAEFNGEYMGENIYGRKGTEPNGVDATDNWYEEEPNFNYNAESFQPAAVHFSQLVWKSTQKFGLGVGYCASNGWYYVVANYYPSGNFLGQFKNNVFPKDSSSTSPESTETYTKEEEKQPEEQLPTPTTTIGSFTYTISNTVGGGQSMSCSFNGVGTVNYSGPFDQCKQKLNQYLNVKLTYSAENTDYALSTFLNTHAPSNASTQVSFVFTLPNMDTTKKVFSAIRGLEAYSG